MTTSIACLQSLRYVSRGSFLDDVKDAVLVREVCAFSMCVSFRRSWAPNIPPPSGDQNGGAMVRPLLPPSSYDYKFTI